MTYDDVTRADAAYEGMPKSADAAIEPAFRSLCVFTKGAQAIAVEVVDYAKRSAQSTATACEKLMDAKSLEKAIEVQTEYLNASYEDFVAQASKLAALYVDLAKETYQETYKPFDVLLKA